MLFSRILRVAGVLFLLSVLVGQVSADFLQSGAPDIDQSELKAQTLPHFEVLAKVLSPSVVNISVETETESGEGEEGGLPPGFPFFKNQPGQPVHSLGSGFILSKDGIICTNYHVVEKAERIIVRLLDDRKEYEAELIGKDEKTDLALLKIDSDKKLDPVFIGDSDDLEVGEWVMAIGNQFQLGQTVTAGIVSAKSRKVRSKSGGPYDDFIQTDASINPGSSGGPLFNSRGQVIGINTAIFSPGRNQFGGTGFNIGIGFAIPINLAKLILGQLKDQGKVTRGVLGVIIQAIDGEMAEALGQKDAVGALVAEVVPSSPAAEAGFLPRDIILEYDGHPVEDHDDLPLLVANTQLGAQVDVLIIRNKSKKVLHPTIVELKDDFFTMVDTVEAPTKPNELGVIVKELNEILARTLKLPKSEGVIITNIESGSPAHKAGLSVGDIIVELNNQEVGSAKDLERILKNAARDKPLLLLIHTKIKGQITSRFLTVKLPK